MPSGVISALITLKVLGRELERHILDYLVFSLCSPSHSRGKDNMLTLTSMQISSNVPKQGQKIDSFE